MPGVCVVAVVTGGVVGVWVVAVVTGGVVGVCVVAVVPGVCGVGVVLAGLVVCAWVEAGAAHR